MTVYFELISAQGASSRMALQPGLQRIKAAPGDRYRIYDDATGRTPPDIVVKRLDSHMVISGLPGGPTVELSDFYASCGVSSPCTLVVDGGGLFPGAPIEVSPASPPLQALTDGSFIVYPPGYSGAPAIAVADSEGFPRAAAYAIGGLAIVALAAAGGGGSGDDSAPPTAVSPTPTPSPSPSPPPSPAPGSTPAPAPSPPPPGTVDVTPPDRPVVTSDLTGESRTPLIAGRAEGGATVRLDIDSDRDGSANASYVTTADAGGGWRIDLATQSPSAGGLPAGGLPAGAATIMTVVAIDASQNTSVATQFEVTVEAPAPDTVAAVTAVTDNAAPRTGNVADGGATNDNTPTVSGTLSSPLAPGESVQVLRNGAAVGGPVIVQGSSWQVTDTPIGDGAYAYTARVVDSQGAGASGAGYRIVVDTANNKTASIESVTDNVAPSVGLVREGGTTNDPTPTLAGAVSAPLAPGEELQILRDDAVIGTPAQVSGTSWSFTDSLAGNGRYDYTVRVVDPAGNIGRESDVYDVRLALRRGNSDGNGGGDDDDDDDDDDSGGGGERQSFQPDPLVVSLTLDELLDANATASSSAAPMTVAGSAGAFTAAPGSDPLDQLLAS